MFLNYLQIGVFVLTLTTSIIHASGVKSTKYIGAVVEYHPLSPKSDKDDLRAILETNAKNYETIIKKAAEYNVDIIVFPEYGLDRLPREGINTKRLEQLQFRAYYQDTLSYIPHPDESVVLCNSTDPKYTKSLQIVSCAALKYGMYVVVNHHERADCPRKNCSPDGHLLYNTNVVFDRTGKVIARYRKTNLYNNEYGTNVTATPEHSIFRTDFGVTFGQFICFDLMFEKPTTFFVEHPEVTDIVYSMHWYDGAPFYYHTKIHAGYAHAADVNFLASSYSNVSTYSGGSGIYAGRSGPIRMYRERKSSNALIIAEIPKYNRHNRVDVRTLKSFVYEFKDDEVATVTDTLVAPSLNGSLFLRDLTLYSTRLLDPIYSPENITLCNRGLCCDFHVKFANNIDAAGKSLSDDQYRYRLVVFNGVSFADIGKTTGLEVCLLLNCVGEDFSQCGTVSSPGEFATRVESLEITRRAKLTDRSLYTPWTLSRKYVPYSATMFDYSESKSHTFSRLRMHLARPRGDLLIFGIFGRRYDLDGQEVTK